MSSNIFTRSLWPETVKAPYQRLAIAFVLAPLIVALFFSVLAFLIAGMTEVTHEGTVRATADSAAAIFALVFGYTAVFGAIGMMILWSTAQRGPLAWALTGAVLGAIAAFFFGMVFVGELEQPVLLVFMLASWALFVLIRWIAGIRNDR